MKRACSRSDTDPGAVPVGYPTSVAHTCFSPSPLALMSSWISGTWSVLPYRFVGERGKLAYGCMATASNDGAAPCAYSSRNHRYGEYDTPSDPRLSSRAPAGAAPPVSTNASGARSAMAACAAVRSAAYAAGSGRGFQKRTEFGSFQISQSWIPRGAYRSTAAATNPA